MARIESKVIISLFDVAMADKLKVANYCGSHWKYTDRFQTKGGS